MRRFLRPTYTGILVVFCAIPPLLATGAEEAQPLNVEKTVEKASTDECKEVANENQEYVRYMLEEDLKVTAQGGDTLLSEIFEKKYPKAIQKIMAYNFTLTLPEQPEGWDDFSAVLHSSGTMRTCVGATTVADIVSWSKGDASMFGQIVERWTKRMAELDTANKERTSGRFKSFEDAYSTLSPLVEDDGSGGLSILNDPMSLKGKIVVTRMRVAQVVGERTLLLTNLPTGFPELDGKFYFGAISAGYSGSRDFVDDQIVDVVGEVTGTHQYPTLLAAKKTVPAIRIYGVRPAR